jgi:hypothetical protein
MTHIKHQQCTRHWQAQLVRHSHGRTPFSIVWPCRFFCFAAYQASLDGRLSPTCAVPQPRSQ